MVDSIVATLPPEWAAVVRLLSIPISWIPDVQDTLLKLAWDVDAGSFTLLARLLLLLPVLLVVVGIWSTMLSLYTVPFRSQRGEFLVALALTWWENLRAIWLFWVGLARFLWMVVGWLWGLLRLTVELTFKALKSVVMTPFRFLDWLGSKYFKPGVPWLAFLLTIGWSALEALIFTYALMPTVSEVFYDLSGVESQQIMAPILFIFLLALISGSFACIQVLAEAMARRQTKQVVQMLFVEFFVMFFEVFFLYRELIDAITPWIAAQTGVQLGFWSTLAMASFGWLGIRAMTWFLFGRFGTPALLAVLSRQSLAVGTSAEGRPRAPEPDWWRGPIQALKAENEWFRAGSRELLELLSLPVLQLLAAAVNCVTVVIASRPAFSLPFTSLEHVMVRDTFERVLRRGGASRAGDER
jgi:hypothetical protein